MADALWGKNATFFHSIFRRNFRFEVFSPLPKGSEPDFDWRWRELSSAGTDSPKKRKRSEKRERRIKRREFIPKKIVWERLENVIAHVFPVSPVFRFQI